jgi:hypothetical protein
VALLQLNAVLPGIKEWIHAPDLAFVKTWRERVNSSMPSIHLGSNEMPDFAGVRHQCCFARQCCGSTSQRQSCPAADLLRALAGPVSAVKACCHTLPGSALHCIQTELCSTVLVLLAAAIAYPRCSNCDNVLPGSANRCAQCRVAKYCNRQCQVQHWKQGGHKQECAQLAAARAAGSSQK